MRLSILFISLIVFSCSHVRSGKYIRLKNVEHLKKISNDYNVKIDELKLLNTGKLSPGRWIFVPLNEGIISNPNIQSFYLSRFESDFLWPVPAVKKISSKFGKRWGRAHEGIDIAAPKGTHFLASREGRVIYSGSRLPSYGNMVIIDHGNGLHSVYAHANSLFVSRGDRVSRGQVIGKVGSTGRSTGPHLHFEIRKKRKALNPEKFLVIN